MKSKKILANTFTILAVLLMGAFVPFLINANKEVKAEVLEVKITRCVPRSYSSDSDADFEINFKTNHKCTFDMVVTVYDRQTDPTPSKHYVYDLTIEKSENYLHKEINNKASNYYNFDIAQMRVEVEITKLEKVTTTAEHLGFMLPALSTLFAGFAIYAFVDLKKAKK